MSKPCARCGDLRVKKYSPPELDGFYVWLCERHWNHADEARRASNAAIYKPRQDAGKREVQA